MWTRSILGTINNNMEITTKLSRKMCKNYTCRSEEFNELNTGEEENVEKRTCSCRPSTSYPLLGRSKYCRQRIYGSLRLTIVHACFVGIILMSTSCQATRRMSTDKAPIISSDGFASDGFRQFVPNLSLSGTPIGRDASLNLGEESYDGLSFQTFKVLERWGNDTDILLIGGKDHVYMLDGNYATDNGATITYRERLTWRTPTKSTNVCLSIPGQPAELCKNFIRFIELLDNGQLMVCGTNAYSPACRYYEREQFREVISGEDSEYQVEEKCRGQCVVPHNPTTASVSLYTNTDNGHQIFAAVINDVMSNHPIIMRKDKPTLLSNSLWLNEPSFVKLLEYKDKVYIFFREAAEESESGSPEKAVYARVAQVCKNDLGGMNVLAQQWTTFLKARLLCGHPEKQRLQYDNLTSVSNVVTLPPSLSDGDETNVFFATFTTPWEWTDASMSAVCAYSMNDVKKLFDSGRFFGDYEVELRPLSRRDMHSVQPSANGDATFEKMRRSFAVSPDDVPRPRPGSCGQEYSPNALYFAKVHPLMYDSVTPLSLAPLHVFHDLRATQVAVDDNAGGGGKLMLYIGTEQGEVLRLRTTLDERKLKTVLIESVSVASREKCEREGGCGIRSLHVSGSASSTRAVFLAFSDSMVQFPVARCTALMTKECCSVDPDCGWDGVACVFRTSLNSCMLAPILQDSDSLPGSCGAAPGSTKTCKCDKQEVGELLGEKDPSLGDDSLVVDERILSLIDGSDRVDLRSVLGDSASKTLGRQFQDTMNYVGGKGERADIVRQLKEAVGSTVGLVLQNHRQEYCLPSQAVNHLTHVYPLLLREIELWHEMALKKMNDTAFHQKCWTDRKKKCPRRVSFSLPLLPAVWGPLSKLIEGFSGRCRSISSSDKDAVTFRPSPKTRCASLPGMEPCKDTEQPHCKSMKCEFPNYAVDAKAFFRHANDSRRFLTYGVEPLRKQVNITIPRKSPISGHLEVLVSANMPFVIDYSSVAEKVKIMFHYQPVRDCALSDASCSGTAPDCDPEVEGVVDDWFDWAVRKMSRRMRKCVKEIGAYKKSARKTGRRRPIAVDELRPIAVDELHPHDWQLDERTNGWNTIPDVQDRCKRVSGKVGGSRLRPITSNVWSMIALRAQNAGAIYTRFQQKIELVRLRDVLSFFESECASSQEHTLQRKTFRKRMAKRKSRSVMLVQPMVTTTTPFVIERSEDGEITMRYFVMEAPTAE